MRLIPLDHRCRNRPQVEAADVGPFQQALPEHTILCQGGNHQARSERVAQLSGRDLGHTDERKEEFLVRQGMVRVVAEDDGGQQVGSTLEPYQAIRPPVSGRDILVAPLGQACGLMVSWMPSATSGFEKAAKVARSSSRGSGTIAANCSASASASSRPCDGVRMLEALMQDRPPLAATDAEIRPR